MKFKKSDREKRIAEKNRFLNKDFPWLWAIRQEWHLGIGLVSAHNADNSIFHPRIFLVDDPCEYYKNMEVWIRITKNEPAYGEIQKVIRIQPKDRACWAQQILQQTPKGYHVTHLAFVEKAHEEFPIVTIYRTPKRDKYLDTLLNEMNQARKVMKQGAVNA